MAISSKSCIIMSAMIGDNNELIGISKTCLQNLLLKVKKQILQS